MHACLLLLVASAASAQSDLAAGTQLTYQGSLAAADADAQSATRKPFDLVCWIQKSDAGGWEVHWLVDERGRGEWPWTERFGAVRIGATGNVTGDPPALLYDRPERPGPAGKTPAGQDVVSILLPILPSEHPLAPDAEWQNERYRFHVEQAGKRGGRSVWQAALGDAQGRKGTVWLDEHSPLLVALQQQLTLGRGDEYVLKLELLGVDQPDAAAFAAETKAFDTALALRARLERPRRSPAISWKPDELALLEQALPDWERAAEGTALAKLAAAAARDLKQQSGRSDAVAELAAEHLGKPVEAFDVRGAGDDRLAAADLEGQVTVLHFWEYRDEPLKEPYGQVGYLDFLHHRRKAGGVRVYGVAVDGRFNDEATRSAAQRSVRKLKEFMNLSYPVLYDGGGLLKKFGDPRVPGATLPLFVVVGRDGKIAHYHVGTYDVHQDQGLKELDEAVQAAAAAKRSESRE